MAHASATQRILDRVFPRTPDFFRLLTEQTAILVKAMDEFVAFMQEEGAKARGKAVRQLEHEGDELKERNLDILNRAFSTPMDREDIYRAITTIDHIINYSKTTVREFEVLDLKPDAHTLAMAEILRDGAHSLHAGFSKLATDPAAAEADAQATRKAERRIEKIYRGALAELFGQATLMEEALKHGDKHAEAKAMHVVVETFKRREVYRHLSNAGDRLAHAGEVLHDIIVKLV